MNAATDRDEGSDNNRRSLRTQSPRLRWGTHHRPRQPRILRIVSALCYLALIAYVVRLGVTRWNSLPANPHGGLQPGVPGVPPIDSDQDRTAELTAALSAFPALPAFTPPEAPDRDCWHLQTGMLVVVADALNGSWTPESRPHLQAVNAYITSPSVQSVVERLAAVPPGGWRPLRADGPGMAGGRIVRAPARLLVVRSRYLHSEIGDIDAAVEQMRIVHRLNALVRNSGSFIYVLTAAACENLADHETVNLAREHDLTPAQTRRCIAGILADTGDQATLWNATIDGLYAPLEAMIDLAYTRDDDGNGWLVLSYFDGILVATPAKQRRSGAWNLLSPLFNDRRTVTARVSRLRGFCEATG